MGRGRIRSDGGFSLVELTVVLLIVSVLVVIGVAGYARLVAVSDDKAAQFDVVTAVKVQALHQLQYGAFTDDAALLTPLEPTLEYSVDGVVGTVVVRLEAATSATDVCVFAQTPAGNWFAAHHSLETGNRFATSEPVACTSAVVTTWSSESW